MQKLLGNHDKGLIFILSGPAGTGKTTLAHKLKEEYSCIIQSIAYTTRDPRKGEVNGEHYNFVNKREFEQKIKDNEFLEYATIYGNYYGTSKVWVEEKLNQGFHVLLAIDTQGAMQIKEKLDVVTIFVQAPSMSELKNRLEKRSSDSQDSIEKRIKWAKHEIEMKHKYDYLIVNDDLKLAYRVLQSILIAEEHKQR